MIKVEADIERKLLKFRFGGRVTVDEMRAALERTRVVIKDLAPGFRLLSDLTRLESMEPGCATIIEQTMEVCDQAGVAKIVRVIPDPQKDIGLSIMSLFHYRRRVPTATCETLEEAARALGD